MIVVNRRVAALVAVLLAAALGVVFRAQSSHADPPAGGLVAVSSFGSNPGSLAMYTYTPSGLPSGRPVVVALHGCGQTANDYYAHSGWPALADRWKFEVVFPQTSSANNSLSCFNWYSTADDTRGQGEAASIRSMVANAVSTHSSDAKRVFVTGLSAGGAMTANLLAAYPDVFAAGSVDSGIPAQCATSITQATNCQNTDQRLTPAQWAARVTAQAPSGTATWPKVAIWQGSADYTVYPVNGTELRDQWTAVHGVSQTPTSTTSLTGGTTLTQYADSAGRVQVQLYSIAGMGHGLAVDPGSGDTQCGSTASYFLDYICSSYYTGVFFGLDDGTAGQPGGGDPTTTPPGTTPPGTTPPSGACYTATNYAQVQAGRAHQSGGYTYADGSNQNMGLYNVYETHTLKQTANDYYVIADGAC